MGVWNPLHAAEREVFLLRLALNGFLGFGRGRGGGVLQVLNIVLPACWILVSGYIQLWHSPLALVPLRSPSLSLSLPHPVSHTDTLISLDFKGSLLGGPTATLPSHGSLLT